MSSLLQRVDELAGERDFSGVVPITRCDSVEFEQAYGVAGRAHDVPCRTDTMFAMASGTKGLTALVIASLISDGVLGWDTTARSMLGADLPLVADDVTVEHLLAHLSGIGDYLDEAAEQDQPRRVPVQALTSSEAYLLALDGFVAAFTAGAQFAYYTSGYAILAVLAECASGQAFPDLIARRVLTPAEMRRTAFLRSDELPGDAAIGYLPDRRTNVFHLPVRSSGDGGAHSTVADTRSFWSSLFAGDIVFLCTGETAHGAVQRRSCREHALRTGLLAGSRWPEVILEGWRRRRVLSIGSRPGTTPDPHRRRQHPRRRHRCAQPPHEWIAHRPMTSEPRPLTVGTD